MSLSVFKPCNKSLYKIETSNYQSTDKDDVIRQSPLYLKQYSLKPKKNKKKKYKKRWNSNLKEIAIEKAKEVGLTKATRYLQMTYPSEFAELCASTLQYWLQKK